MRTHLLGITRGLSSLVVLLLLAACGGGGGGGDDGPTPPPFIAPSLTVSPQDPYRPASIAALRSWYWTIPPAPASRQQQ